MTPQIRHDKTKRINEYRNPGRHPATGLPRGAELSAGTLHRKSVQGREDLVGLHGSHIALDLQILGNQPRRGDELETVPQGVAHRQSLLVLLGNDPARFTGYPAVESRR